jgi:PAS domain S-box-containing protein
VLYNATLFKNELDEIQGVFAAARDITEQKKAEQQLKEHAQRTSVLNDIIRVINEASDIPTLFGQALATTFERLGFAAGFIATENESGRLQVRYAHNLPQKFVESLKLIEIDANARLRNVHQKGKPIVVDELAADTLAARCGMKGGAVSLPVFSEGALIGEFTLYALRPHIFTLEERDLLLAIATEFGTALSKLEAQDTARHYSEELARYSAHLEELVEERTAQLHQSEEYFRTLFETSPIAQVRYDVDGRPVRANNAMLDLFGIADVSAIQHITLFVSPRIPDEAKAWLHAGHPTRYEQCYDFDEIRAQDHFPTTNTGVRYFDMHFAPLFDAATRDVSGYIGQIADITERKRAEEALQDAQRLAGIGETAAMIGHDLRNPLQGLQYIVDLQRLRFERMSVGQRNRDEWEKEQELFAKISEQIFYMDKIVGDLQDYARPLVPELEEIAVKTLIDDVISSLPPTDGVRITTDIEDLRVAADPHLMHRVFSNLFLNAVQAMPDGGTLTVSAAVEDGLVAIRVHDTGVGIRTELQDKLFKPLFTSKAKGTGLGLAVVKRIVEAHEGQVTVESEVGKGSTFTVRLPVTEELKRERDSPS